MCVENTGWSRLEYGETYDTPIEGPGVSRSFYTYPYEKSGFPEDLSGVGKADLGRMGENLAAVFLEDLGYSIIERNWHCRRGEVDIVTETPEGCLALVEVKTRIDGGFGDCVPECAVDEDKQLRYGLLSKEYLGGAVDSVPSRCDVVSIIVKPGSDLGIRLLTGAFFLDR